MAADPASVDVRRLLDESIVWDNHACMPMRPGDTEVKDAEYKDATG